MATVSEVRKAIMETRVRSAWDKGVKLYALELLDSLKENRRLGESDELEPVTRQEILNGAADWKEYSEGGCSLVYNGEICSRLCPPSEQKKKKNGELPPNNHETWLEVQARSLRQAAHLFCRSMGKVQNRPFCADYKN